MHTTIKFRSYKKFDRDKFLEDLEKILWSVLDSLSNINDILDIFYKMFIDVLDKHAPPREKRVKRNNQPEWMNEDILQHMSQHDHYKEIGGEESYRAS